MYKVIVFGTGVTAKDVLYKLNDNCKIVCYLDNNNEMWGRFNGIEVKSPTLIKDLSYDFIIIASQYNDEIYEQLISLGVDSKKILQYYMVIDAEYNYIKSAMDTFLTSEKEYEMLATGISYCNLGLRETIMETPCFKFAFGSQDLYYDYNIIKFILDNHKEKCKKLKYSLIGLSYYSFQYDMSLSSIKNKTTLYYDALGLVHNHSEIVNYNEDYFCSKRIADKIFRVGKDGKYINEYDTKDEVPNYKTKEELGKIQAERDCNKNHPKTVEENIHIFEEYIKTLRENNIKPVIVVFPATKYYYNYFSKRIENEFNSIIYSMKKKYDFIYLDYFRSHKFDDKDFSDVSHLNGVGAQKVTELIDNHIKNYHNVLNANKNYN